MVGSKSLKSDAGKNHFNNIFNRLYNASVLSLGLLSVFGNYTYAANLTIPLLNTNIVKNLKVGDQSKTYMIDYADYIAHIKNKNHKDSYLNYPNLFDTEHPVLEEIIGLLELPTDSKENDAQKILEFVQSLRYLDDPKGGYAKSPIETLVEDGGDCEDLTILAYSLMKMVDLDIIYVFFEGDKDVSGVRGVGHVLVAVAGDFDRSSERITEFEKNNGFRLDKDEYGNITIDKKSFQDELSRKRKTAIELAKKKRIGQSSIDLYTANELNRITLELSDVLMNMEYSLDFEGKKYFFAETTGSYGRVGLFSTKYLRKIKEKEYRVFK